MEPNVDRGMWSVVALLAAIVIGGVVLIAFPRISGKIANNMDDTVNKAFTGELPDWVEEDIVNPNLINIEKLSLSGGVSQKLELIPGENPKDTILRINKITQQTGAIHLLPAIPYKAGDEYTVSALVRVTKDVDDKITVPNNEKFENPFLTFYDQDKREHLSMAMVNKVNSEWSYITANFKHDKDIENLRVFAYGKIQTGSETEYKQIKLEKGLKPTRFEGYDK